MSNNKLVRVAAAQYSVGSDIQKNLESALRVIARAAQSKPRLLVLPEFINHLSWYDSLEHCYEVSLEPGGDFLKQLAKAARDAGCYLVANCTMRREQGRCSGSSLMFSADGELLGVNDKQVLIGHENNFLQRARRAGPIIETPFARLGMYACMDGVIFETPRYLALRGGQILCNSVNSFAPDESSLHIPVRAAENKVFVVAANKIGPLAPADLLDELSAVTNIPKQFLCGAGESQIVDPEGTVLAIASPDQEEVVFADIDPAQADHKLRPDGSGLFHLRRPGLYSPIAQDPDTQPPAPAKTSGPVSVAMIPLPEPASAHLGPVAEQVAQAASAGAELIVLPELFCFDLRAEITLDSCAEAERAVQMLATVCGSAHVAASFPWRDDRGRLIHAALLVNRDGVQCVQGQLHVGNRHAWAAAADGINTLDLPFAHIGMVTGEDVIFPEVFRLLAIKGVDTVLAPYAAQEDWEVKTGLLERAAENHINLVAVNAGTQADSSFAARLHRDFTILTPWESRKFDGKLTFPPTTFARPPLACTLAEITPSNAANKVVSSGTDLLQDRAWKLAAPLVDSHSPSRQQVTQ